MVHEQRGWRCVADTAIGYTGLIDGNDQLGLAVVVQIAERRRHDRRRTLPDEGGACRGLELHIVPEVPEQRGPATDVPKEHVRKAITVDIGNRGAVLSRVETAEREAGAREAVGEHPWLRRTG